jgi:hypothetical protein
MTDASRIGLSSAAIIAVVILAIDPFGPRTVPSPLPDAPPQAHAARPDDAGPAPSGDASPDAAEAEPDAAGAPPQPSPGEDPRVYDASYRHWPLPRWCVYDQNSCRTAGGEPGLRCGGDPVCFNPCPKGTAPRGNYCSRVCRSGADCRGGKCELDDPACPGGRCKTGLCNLWPDVTGYTDSCDLSSGHTGLVVHRKCVSPCRPGFFLYGGTNCVKQCKTDADCNGTQGACMTEDGRDYFCGGLCPSEACPYPYD